MRFVGHLSEALEGFIVELEQGAIMARHHHSAIHRRRDGFSGWVPLPNAWTFNFGNGRRYLLLQGDSLFLGFRAVCVRRSGD
jgi:hypothetical protein